MAQSLFALSNIDSSEKKQLSEQSRPEVRCSRSSLDSAAIVQNPSQRLLSWTMLALRLIQGKMRQKRGARGGGQTMERWLVVLGLAVMQCPAVAVASPGSPDDHARLGEAIVTLKSAEQAVCIG
jgi:hypothetical protein